MELEKNLTRKTEKLSLQGGVYTNTSTFVPIIIGDSPPKWEPGHPEPLWHPGLGLEVRVVGINEAAGIIQYRIRIENSSDTTERIALEHQLQTLEDADRLPVNGMLPVNRAPWAPTKEVMLKFLASYPIPDAETRKQLEAQIRSKNKGLASALVEERGSELGIFNGEANLIERMNNRCPGFPWEAIAPLFDYSLPNR